MLASDQVVFLVRSRKTNEKGYYLVRKVLLPRMYKEFIQLLGKATQQKNGKEVNRHFSEVEVNKNKKMIGFINDEEEGIKTVLYHFIRPCERIPGVRVWLGGAVVFRERALAHPDWDLGERLDGVWRGEDDCAL